MTGNRERQADGIERSVLTTQRAARAILTVLLLAAGPVLVAQQTRWVMAVDPVMGVDSPRRLAEEIAATYGGRVLRSAGLGDQFVIELPDARERQLAADPRVQGVRPAFSPGTQATQVVPAVDWAGGVSYDYDGSGNVKTIGDDVFVYDHVGRLVQASVNGDIRRYTYDAFGNRTDCSQVSANGAVGKCQYYEISSTSNRVEAATYDDAGNVTALDGQRFKWDAVNMMTRKDGPGASREFVYTADDERIATYEVGSTWRWTVRDTSGKVLREFTSLDGADGPGTAGWQWAKDYVWREGLLLATVQPEGSSITTYHYHLDHLGTPRLVTDQDERAVGVHDYYAFGPELSTSVSESNATRLKYTGHERDTDGAGLLGGLDYMHARYYSPTMGRFLSVDPVLDIKKNLSEPQMWNRYAYVTNNPLKFTDPDGRYRTFYGEKPMHTMGNDAPPVIGAALAAPVAVLAVGAALEGLSYAALTAAVRHPVLFSAVMAWLQGETGTAGRWGVNTYRRGGTMTTIEHINYRHGFDSGFSNVSRFAKGTSVRDIKGYVETALKYGKATTDRGSVTVVQDLGKVIGTDAAGKNATRIEVIVRDGVIQTAYPIR